MIDTEPWPLLSCVSKQRIITRQASCLGLDDVVAASEASAAFFRRRRSVCVCV